MSATGVGENISMSIFNIEISTTKRRSLPFREKCEVFLLHGKGQVVAQDRGHYIMFPGGGVDHGENVKATAKRETLEETGVSVDGPLKYTVTVDFVWHPEWANNHKRRERYAKFQGERVHIFIGRTKLIGEPTSDEGDGWTGRKTMSIQKCIELAIKYGESDHPNTYAYRIAQLSSLQALRIIA